MADEEIRRKRLAKLSQPATSSGSSSRSSPSQTRSATPSASDSRGNSPATGSAKVYSDPLANQQSQQLQQQQRQPQPAASASSASAKAKSSKPVVPVAQESLSQWTERTLNEVLQVSLSETSSSTLVYLKDAADDIGDSHITVDTLDQVLWHCVRQPKFHHPTFVAYLFACWSRAQSLIAALRRKKDADGPAKMDSLKAAQTALARFTVISAIADPEEKWLFSDLGEALLQLSGRNPWDFARAVIDAAYEQDMMNDILSSIFDTVCRDLRKKILASADPMADLTPASLAAMTAPTPPPAASSYDYKPHFKILEELVTDKKVAAAITRLDRFKIKSNYDAKSVSFDTLLGPFFAVSPIENGDLVNMFPNPDLISQVEMDRVSVDIRVESKVIQDRLFFICHQIVRSSAEARQDLLTFFARILKVNRRRLAMMQTRASDTCSDGFMINISKVLEKFCEPFVDMMGSKIDKIDMSYFCSKSSVLDISEETKILSDTAQSKTFYEENASDSVPNFISHMFFLMAAYMQYGINGCLQSLERSKRVIDDLKFQIQRLEPVVNMPSPRQAFMRMAFERAKRALHTAQAKRLALQALLTDELMAVNFLEIAVFQLIFAVRAAEPSHSYPDPHKILHLPLPEDPLSSIPQAYANYPEFMIEGAMSYLIFISRAMPRVLMQHSYISMVQYCVVFLTSTPYIKNPYLKAKLVELLFYGAIDIAGQRGYFVGIFDSDPLCLEYLLHGLMRFYIECEQTGASSQFYDKFNTRFYISEILKCIWANNMYRTKLENESKHNITFFVRFVALLLNDVTYLLDESLTKLGEIHKLQKEIAENPASANEPLQRDGGSEGGSNGNNGDEESGDTTRASNLASAERHAKSYMQLANKSVLLLKMFTSAVPKAFVTPEIVDRLAAMLNYNLAALVGPRCRELKVEDPEKYGFNPKQLLSLMCDVYLNLSSEDSFIKAVARDGRSYNPDNFDRCHSILSRWALKPVPILNKLADFKASAERAKQEEEEGELELGDIPDEFLDPLMYTLMEEPVTLPSSRVVIDLGTIKSHLLSDAKDPFNRAPLKIEEVIPNPELKAKIQAWKDEQRQKFRSEKASSASNQDIDVEMS